MSRLFLSLSIAFIIILSIALFKREKLETLHSSVPQELKEEELKSKALDTPPQKLQRPETTDVSEREKRQIQRSENQQITQETKREFLALSIPDKFSSSPKERYLQINTIYLTCSFYLNEVAAGNLSTNKSELLKALKGVALYFKEMESLQQPDSALAMVEQNHLALFNEVLLELSPTEKSLIEEALKLQADEE